MTRKLQRIADRFESHAHVDPSLWPLSKAVTSAARDAAIGREASDALLDVLCHLRYRGKHDPEAAESAVKLFNIIDVRMK